MTVRLLILLFLAFLAIACSEAHELTVPALPCLHIRAATGEDYRLGYAGQSCDDVPYPELPQNRYGRVAVWASNASASGILPRLDHFRIVARLATLDQWEAHGFSFHGDGFWREYAWSDWAKRADLIVLDAVKNDSLADTLIEAPLAKARLGSGHGLDLKFRKTSLTRGLALRLGAILSSAEIRLQSLGPMRVVPHTLEQVVMERPEYANARRATFTAYEVVRP